MAAQAHDIGEHFSELDIHLHQRLLHALHPAALLGDQKLTLALHRPQHKHLCVRTECGTQKTQAHELLDPLTVHHIAFAPGHVLHLPGIHQPHLEPLLLKHLIQRDPVHPRGFEGHRIHPALKQPVGHRVQVVRHYTELTNRLIRHMRGNGHPVTRCPYINSRSVGKYLIFSLANCHFVLQNSQRMAAPWEASNLTHSPKRDAQ